VVVVPVGAADVARAVEAARLTAGLGCPFALLAVGLSLALGLGRAIGRGWNVTEGRNVIDGWTGWLDSSSVGRPASRSIPPRDPGSNRSTPGTGTWVRKVSTNALPSMTAMTQIAQTPRCRTAARTPESSLNTGRSVLTALEECAFWPMPPITTTPDMLELDTGSPRRLRLSVKPKRRKYDVATPYGNPLPLSDPIGSSRKIKAEQFMASASHKVMPYSLVRSPSRIPSWGWTLRLSLRRSCWPETACLGS
jgi:hypothetical protein